MLQWLKDRLGEPSTARGVAAILGAVGIAISPEQAAMITSLALAVIGAINVFTKDK